MVSAGREELAASGGQAGALCAAQCVRYQQAAGEGVGCHRSGVRTVSQVGSQRSHFLCLTDGLMGSHRYIALRGCGYPRICATLFRGR